jgi:hypothetical protein
MIAITFPDRDTEKKALGFLLGRFSGRVLKSGKHLLEVALEALRNQNISFLLFQVRLVGLRNLLKFPSILAISV